ncbi:probetacellulin isoform X1 [Neopsephotus bourkii]|uniref:probetacellulin isoform X1 n=1 Tax=Neopsephotus bourkii TaxID=309878 RepID=UPI002AA5CB28|nr:probetacellulin isoform X1 [Neopsephotus bourkii]XP_061209728.1 probetacellulin isoform X1 [Neopsephotus bourkii]
MGAEQCRAEGWDGGWMLYQPQPHREAACHSQGHTLLWLWMDQMPSEENCNPRGGAVFLVTPGNVTQLRRQGHFSRCPEEYKHYCVKGRCRFLMAEKAPACVCERGYTGARCERVDIFYLRGDRGQIVIISLIAAIVTLIILIVCACLCSHHCRKQRRKRKANEMETLNKNLPSKSEDVLETGIA